MFIFVSPLLFSTQKLLFNKLNSPLKLQSYLLMLLSFYIHTYIINTQTGQTRLLSWIYFVHATVAIRLTRDFINTTLCFVHACKAMQDYDNLWCSSKLNYPQPPGLATCDSVSPHICLPEGLVNPQFVLEITLATSESLIFSLAVYSSNKPQ